MHVSCVSAPPITHIVIPNGVRNLHCVTLDDAPISPKQPNNRYPNYLAKEIPHSVRNDNFVLVRCPG